MQLFSVNYDINHIKINFLGLRLSFAQPYRKKNVERFLKHEVLPNTVLITEINCCHLETLPAYCNYFKRLGYNVEVLVNGSDDGVFSRLPYKNKIWKLHTKEISEVLQNKEICQKYEHIVINSKVVYFPHKDIDIEDYLPDLAKGKYQNVYVQHHLEDYDESLKQIVLANPAKKEYLNKFVVNPNYFGDVKITPKNKITQFITVGNLEAERRNIQLLIDAVEQLCKQNIKNFKIVVIGRGDLQALPKNVRNYFEIKGKLSFSDMYKALEISDFFLPLLDPENKAHGRYLTCGTSGSFQLIYGFKKPCIIHEKFANVYGFDETNSICYAKNEKLGEKMSKAINMKNSEYEVLIEGIKRLEKNVTELSIENLKGMLDD